MNLLDLYVNIVAKDEASDKIDGIVGNIGGKIRNGMGTAVKAGAAAVGALTAATATGVVALGKAALDAFSTYEQLAGGAELMFGEAYGFIEQRAKDAYRNVQMSQNEYLAQVNGFATGLKTSLGGNEQAAAELADKIITAEADIVAATGNTQEAVQNAFNGIMRGNYTMLDSLQIGISPTKEGMQEVIDKVNEWNAAQGNLTDYTIDSLADCEAALVDYVSMIGMAGYAQNEAAGTIQGSLATLNAAWANFTTALADKNADIEGVARNLVESFKNAAELIIPVIGTIGEQIAKAIPELLDMLIPVLMDLLNSILENLIPMLPGLVQSIVDGLVQLIPMLIEGALQLFMAIVQALPQIIPALIDAAISAIDSVIDMLPTLLPLLLEAAIRLFMAIVEAIPRIIPALIQALPTVIQAVTSTLLNNIPLLLQCSVELFMALVTAVPMVLGELIGAVGQLLQGVWDTITSFDLGEAAGQLIQGFINGIRNMGGAVINAVSGVFGGAIDFVKGLFGINSPSKVFEGFGEMLDAGMAKGILGSGDDITDAFDSVMGNLSGSAMDVSVNARGLPSMTASTMAGVVITGNTFNVRQESDIEDIANRLALLIDRRG